MNQESKISSTAELTEVAQKIIALLGERKIVAFRGDMGAGKTTLISEIAHQLGSDDVASSPTFAIVNQYNTFPNCTIYHFYFSRINNTWWQLVLVY